MIKLGFVGGGLVADGHITNMLSDERVEVVGVADPSPEARDRITARFGVRTFADQREFPEEYDAVYICTPHHLHKPIGLEAINAGKHVICEKPLAMSFSEAEELVEAAEMAGVELFVAENMRYVPDIVKLREIVESGDIGKPFLCAACYIGDELKRMNDPSSWKCTREQSGGGSIIDAGPHMLDALYFLFGQAKSISAHGARLVAESPNKEEDTAQIIISFKSGVLASCALTFAARYNGFPEGYCGAGVRFDINGTQGAVHATIGESMTIVRGGEKVRVQQPMSCKVPAMDRDFVDAILNGKDPLVTGKDGLYVMRMISACYKSMRERREVEV